jgi:putative sterol carrier protein
MHTPFTQSWADAFRDAINGDPAYRDAGRRWTWAVALVLDKNPAVGFNQDVAIELDLRGGECGGATVVAAPAVTAPFALRGSYHVWKRIVRGALDPVSAVVNGSLALSGSVGVLMEHTGWARALVACARRVPTVFPDERPAGS